MTIRNTYAAEAWDKVYSAFQQVNFTSYDFDTIKESLLQYMKIYHAMPDQRGMQAVQQRMRTFRA
jgi:hypothetical protein